MKKVKKYYTVPEFADKSGVSTQTIYQQLKRGRLKTYGRKINGVQKISEDALTFYKPADDLEPEEPEEQVPEQDSETVVLLKDQIRILTETLEHERENHRLAMEMLKQSQEIMLQEIEAIKAQLVTQHTLIVSDQTEDDQDPQPAEAPDKVQTRSQSPSQQQEAKPAEQAPEHRGFWSRFFGRS